MVDTTAGPLRVVGAYVPSRDSTAAKTERKQAWIRAFDHPAASSRRSNTPSTPA